MKTILITGINGFLGSQIAKKYRKKFKIIGLEYSPKSLFRIKNENYKIYFSKDGISDDYLKSFMISNGFK